MKLYKDLELTQEVKHDKLDFGMVLAGDSQEYIYYVYNDTVAELAGLTFNTENPEVKVLEAPESLKSFGSSILKLKWSPSVTLKEGLKSHLRVRGYEIYQ